MMQRTLRWMVISVLGVLLLYPAVCSADSLKLSLGKERGDTCIEPFDKTVTTRYQPMSFCVALTNNPSSSQSVYWKAEAGGIASLSFELTSEQGETFVVRPKKKPIRSGQVISDYLPAGETFYKVILADMNTWENIPVMEEGQSKKYKVRAIFDNNSSNIYSDYYTVILDGK